MIFNIIKEYLRALFHYEYWNVLMSGNCHQIPERSFYYKGSPFPVCSRCTGVYIGYLIFPITLLFLGLLPIYYYICGVAIILIDWSLQNYLNIMSNNFRRLISGVLGGLSSIGLLYYVVYYIYQTITFFSKSIL